MSRCRQKRLTCYGIIGVRIDIHSSFSLCGAGPQQTTTVYFHLTQKGAEDAYKIIDNTMRGFRFGHDNGKPQ